jgi:hypothetical protein
MMDFRIFAESKADIKFLSDYIAEIFDESLSDNQFDPLGSWSGYRSDGRPKASVQQAFDENKSVILMLDANGDFQERSNDVLEDFKQFNITVQLFLFPNNQSPGNLETMLAEIAVDKKLMDCFLEYERCVQAYPKKLNDSRIYSYLDMLLVGNHKDTKGKDMRQEAFRNYRNKDHWNLDHEYLQPLKIFLTPFFNKNK